MDKGICLRYGRASVIKDEDIAVDLPKQKLYFERYPSGIRNFNPFPSLARLALLESRVYSELYSATSRTKSNAERLLCIRMLDTELQTWKDALPIEVRLGHNILCDNNMSYFFVSTMHLSYYNCLSTIHRASVQHNSWNTRLERVFDWNVQTDSLNPVSTPT